MRIPLAREGYPFILASIVITVAIGYFDLKISFYPLVYPALSLALFVVWFFRDPERDIPADPQAIVSPADGKVIKAERVREERFLNGDAIKISIFMNVFNVHVNRMPSTGKVLGIFYNPGKFINASFDKASLENEQNALLIENAGGKKYVTNQIAGLIARRIVCRVKEGETLEKGTRFGMIRFGSRLDVYLPVDVKLTVKIGDKVSAGSSILAKW